ncbi:MAG: hypothetical protein AAFW87_09305 [Pseudomonadota bacterium]
MRDFVPIPDLQKDSAPFTDQNFKLAVLDALMANGTLDLGDEAAFQAKLTNRRYDYERDGYALNQAFLSYLHLYPLTQTHLAAVEQLYFDGGLDIYAWIYPFWGGDTEDFDIHSMDDIALLPNLRVFEFSSMFGGSDLTPLATARKLEVIGLGLVKAPWRNWQALLQLPNLRKLQFFGTNHTPLADPVLTQLKARGVSISRF